jgi:beta-lactamase class A
MSFVKMKSMPERTTRRRLLLATAVAPLASLLPTSRAAAALHPDLAALERQSGGRLGVAALNTGTGARIAYRADERFAFCSTFKVISVSAVLQRSETRPDLLQRRIAYDRAQLVHYSPVTERHVGAGMTVAELCAAALQYSDNTAANLIIRLLGGPASVTAFARRIGNRAFRQDRWETALNTAIPGDPRDTATPAAMAESLRRLAFGDVLAPPQRAQLVAWMRGNTTGDKRIRAGVPAEWAVADKTGSGDYGTTNDLGVVWPLARPPIVLALYFTQPARNAAMRDDVLAAATRVVMAGFGLG